jgi:hypothetical protein
MGWDGVQREERRLAGKSEKQLGIYREGCGRTRLFITHRTTEALSFSSSSAHGLCASPQRGHKTTVYLWLPDNQC